MDKRLYRVRQAIGLLILLITVSVGNCIYGLDTISLAPGTTLDMDLDFRAYGLNDQRIYWSGLEFSFGAESALDISLQKKYRRSSLTFNAELFLNQPFGENILIDEYRKDYAANFKVDTVEISKLSLRFDIGRFSITIGKAATPFGRVCFIPHSNNLDFGAPFVRSEAILWRETGIFLHWENRFLELDVAAVNGGEERDTNSGKAGIFRVGIHGRYWRIGASHKVHDGTGSEWQKQYKGHTGLDFMIRLGRVRFSGEWIWDRYGFHRPFPENEIFWQRSLYYRDTFLAYKTPIKGKGGYGEIQYRSRKWMIELNYGEYHPQAIGNILHDRPIKRGIVRLAFLFVPDARFYFTGLLENDREREPWNAGAKPFAVLAGCEFTL